MTIVADDLNAYLYLETASQENVSLYEHYGFHVADLVEFPTSSSNKRKSIKKRGSREEENDDSDDDDDVDDDGDVESTLTLYLMIRDPTSLQK